MDRRTDRQTYEVYRKIYFSSLKSFPTTCHLIRIASKATDWRTDGGGMMESQNEVIMAAAEVYDRVSCCCCCCIKKNLVSSACSVYSFNMFFKLPFPAIYSDKFGFFCFFFFVFSCIWKCAKKLKTHNRAETKASN